MKSFLDLYLPIVIVKVLANLRSEASRTYLAYAWWLFEPMLNMAVFYVVFGFLLQRGTENFVAFLLTGLVHWLWFSRSISNGMSAIFSGKTLMTQVYIPKVILPFITILQDAVKQFVVVIVLILFLIVYGIEPTITWIALPFVLLVEFILITAVTLLVAAIIPFIPDLRFIVSAALQMLMFCSGVFYESSRIPEQYLDIYYLNPMATMLESYRSILLYSTWPDFEPLLLIAGIALVILLLSGRLIQRLDYVYPRIAS